LVINNSNKDEEIYLHYSGPESGVIGDIDPGHESTRELPHGEYAFKLEVVTYESGVDHDGPYTHHTSSFGKVGRFVIYAGRSEVITWP